MYGSMDLDGGYHRHPTMFPAVLTTSQHHFRTRQAPEIPELLEAPYHHPAQ